MENTASGFKGVTKTPSGRFHFQARSLAKKHGEQRGLGSFDSAEEAAAAVMLNLQGQHGWQNEKAKRAPRGLVTSPSSACCCAFLLLYALPVMGFPSLLSEQLVSCRLAPTRKQ